MNARRLLHWGDLEEMRQRRARRGLGSLSPWLFSVLAGLGLAAIVANALGALGPQGLSPRNAANLWLATLAGGHVVVLLGAPFRMYWRRDSTILGRSAISGRALFLVALARSSRAAAQVALPCAMAALAFAPGPQGSLDMAARHLALTGMALLWAGLGGPAIALAAGAVVASDKAQAAISSITGEFQAPRTSWLGILPGLGGTALALLLIDLVPWTRGSHVLAAGTPALVLVAGTLAPAVLFAWALTRADRIMVQAVREVAALDQERLAHVGLTGPSPLERLVARRLGQALGDERARALLEKDASLSRRRYPIPFFVGVVGLMAQWIAALAAPLDLLFWAGTISAGLGVYGVIMAWRAMVPPIEHLVFLRTLPVAARVRDRAKRTRLGLWIAVYMGLGAVPVIARAAEPGLAALLLGAILFATYTTGAVVMHNARS